MSLRLMKTFNTLRQNNLVSMEGGSRATLVFNFIDLIGYQSHIKSC